MTEPLAWATADIVGHPFLAIWSPEDDTVRAAGFWATGAGVAGAGAAGAWAAGTGAAGAGAAGAGAAGAGVADPTVDPLWERLRASNPVLAGRGLAPAPAATGAVPAALAAYAAGDLGAIDRLTVAQRETPFRGEVWRALRQVAPGRAVTYSELAALAGRPAAVRAAASGCATNLVALIVPCHRIVRADGGFGGYLFGTEVKQRLLAHEAAAGR